MGGFAARRGSRSIRTRCWLCEVILRRVRGSAGSDVLARNGLEIVAPTRVVSCCTDRGRRARVRSWLKVFEGKQAGYPSPRVGFQWVAVGRGTTHCHRRHHCPSRQADPPGLLAGHADRPRRHRKVPRRGKSIAAGATGARVGVGVLDHQRAGTAGQRHRAVERRARHERGLPSVVPHKGAALGLAILLPHQEDFHQRAKRGEDGLEVRLGYGGDKGDVRFGRGGRGGRLAEGRAHVSPRGARIQFWPRRVSYTDTVPTRVVGARRGWLLADGPGATARLCASGERWGNAAWTRHGLGMCRLRGGRAFRAIMLLCGRVYPLEARPGPLDPVPPSPLSLAPTPCAHWS